MQAIITKYLGPTNTRGSRVKASCQRGSKIVPWDHELCPDENHEAACAALCASFDKQDLVIFGSIGSWSRPKVSGELPDGQVVHVFLPMGDP
jgi:hypothetical protein